MEGFAAASLFSITPGKLALLLDQLRDGVEYLKKGLKVLTVSHGSQHDLVQTLKSTILKACEEMRDKVEYDTIKRMYDEW